MNNKLQWICLAIILLGIWSGVATAQSPRAKYNFNSDWKIYTGDQQGAQEPAFDDRSWKAVTLPHAWNEDEAFKKPIDSLPTGIAWYRKHFKTPDAGSKKVFIEFEGVRMGADIYVNGKLVGTHENGSMAFGLDISNELKPGGENVIALRIDNAWNYKEKATGSGFQWNDKNFNANYGGIPKNVWLHVTDKLYQTLPLYSFLQTKGVYIYAKDFDIPKRMATVVVESEVKNDYAGDKVFLFEAEVKDRDGKIVKNIGAQFTVAAGELKTVSVSARISGLNFWSWGYGYLYTVTTRLKMRNQTTNALSMIASDEVSTVTGFRKTEFKDGMIYLNDRVMMVHGYAQRTSNEWPAVGMSVPAWLSDYSNGLMVAGNGNLVRWMHITPWKQDIESCDRVGLLQAMPAGDAEKDVTDRRWGQRTEVMRDAIIYNRNNPSIAFYESGNESISAAHMEEMKAIRNQYDPFGGRASGSREMLDIPGAEYGGEMLYVNKSAAKPLWAMEYLRDEALRKYWDDYTFPFHKNGDGPLYKGANAAAYNQNQDSFAINTVKAWNDYWLERPGTGKRVSAGGVNIVFSDSNTHFRGSENYRRSGEVDALRIAKDAYYANKVMWDGWVEPDKKGIHLVGHWNYNAGVKKDVYVVAAGEKAELFLNGKSLGLGKQSDNFLFTFAGVSFQPGTLKAVSYDKNGSKLAETQLITTGEAVSLRLKAIQHPQGMHADGADLALIEVEAVDAKGNRVPTAFNMVSFDLQGPAEWRGGMAQGPGNYILAKSLPVEAGVNRVLVRSTTTAGKIIMTATASGLKPASITLQTLPITTRSGLGNWFPASGLSGHLGRGATPAGSSYTVTRKSLTIKSATAGANADKAAASFDDNELSDWVNDGKPATAWITYTLNRPAVINAVGMKLNNFRSRSYPLVILVDDRVVFEGASKTGLGYYTQLVKPTKGGTVTVKLGTGKSDQQSVDIGLEVTGKKLDDGVARDERKTSGNLSLIEFDIFGE